MKHSPAQLAHISMSLVLSSMFATETLASQLEWRSPGQSNVSAVQTSATLVPVPPRSPSTAAERTPISTTLPNQSSVQPATHYNPLAPADAKPAPVQRSTHTQNLPPLKNIAGGQKQSSQELPDSHGQIWKLYDLRPYTHRANVPGDKPEQAIVDWVLRETGTQTWFTEPFGALSADRDTLRVYHTPAIQNVVSDIVNRFMKAGQSQLAFGGRLVTLANPDWRTTALPIMRPVTVQSPGVEAWLLSKENAAVLLSQLRARSDYREHDTSNSLIRNGETRDINRTRPISYIHSLQTGTQSLGAANLMPNLRRIDEGFKMQISPLMATDDRTVDAVVKIETSQLEKLSNVYLNLAVGAAVQRAEIQVPQTSSWRLHERFRWPVDEVLVISCGLVASPDLKAQPSGILRAFTGRPARSESLLFLEARSIPQSGAPSSPTASTGDMNHRDRY